MYPVNFKDANLRLVSPKNWDDELYGICDYLSVQRKDGICKSCWKMSIKEWMKLLFTRCVYVYVHSGKTQPPIKLDIK